MLINNNKNLQANNKPLAFGNAGFVGPLLTSGFAFLEKAPIFEIVGIDFTTMVAPRTAIDYKQNPEYGRETAFRELSAMLFVPFMSGILGNFMMRQKGYKGLYTNSTTLKTLHHAWENAGELPHEERYKKYLHNVFKNTECLVGGEWRSIPDKHIGEFVEEVAKISAEGGKESSKQILKATENFTKINLADANIRVNNLGKEPLYTNIRNLIRDSVGAGKKVFMEKLNPGQTLAAKVDDLCKFMRKRTVIAVAMTMAGGSLLQFINTKITKMKTGNGEFAGYKDFGKNKDEDDHKPKNPTAFLLKKVTAATAAVAMTLGCMGAFGKKGFFKKGVGWNNFLNAVELKDRFAHVGILQLIAGSIFIGRFMSARDETELKIGTIRDYAAFMNWLVLGPVISKGVASLKDKSLLNGTATGKNIFTKSLSWLGDVSLKTAGEIEAMWPGNRSKQQAYNTSKLVGLGWSLFALGIGMPHFLNTHIINKSRKTQNKNHDKVVYNNFITNNSNAYEKYIGLRNNA